MNFKMIRGHYKVGDHTLDQSCIPRFTALNQDDDIKRTPLMLAHTVCMQ